jgi:hypothetical protein
MKIPGMKNYCGLQADNSGWFIHMKKGLMA